MVGTGVPPTAMADEIRSQINLLPFLGKDLLTPLSATGNVQLVGDRVDLAVPQGEAWLMVAGQANMAVGAAGEQVALGYVVFQGTLGSRVANLPIQTAVAAAANITIGFAFPQPVLLTPGNQVSLIVDDINVAAARVASVAALAYRFDY